MSLIFNLKEPLSFLSGQHVDVRITAADGYQAERSYSIANAPEQNEIVELGVEILEDGEISPYLFNMKIGNQIEMRGPIGKHFVWNAQMPEPLILIGGGSGMVPLMSMLRHHILNLKPDSKQKIIFLISARTLPRVLYKKELEKIAAADPNVKIIETLTESAPKNWTGYARRVDSTMLLETIGDLKNQNPRTYVCGPNPFVAAVTNEMVALGFDPKAIKTERFGD